MCRPQIAGKRHMKCAYIVKAGFVVFLHALLQSEPSDVTRSVSEGERSK